LIKKRKVFTYAKQDRLTRRPQFVQLSASGEKIVGKHFFAIIASGATLRTRLGVTVTRKVGNAVQRNRIKRQAREYFRLHRDKISGIWDINIIAKKGADRASNSALRRSLADIFARIEIKHGPSEPY